MIKYQKFEDEDNNELKVVTAHRPRYSRLLLLIVLICFGVVVVCFLLAILFIFYSRSLQTINKANDWLPENIGIDLQDQDYIIEEYHNLTKKDRMHVVKDYSKKVQIMKISNEEMSICYLAPLNSSPPQARSKSDKLYTSVVYEVKDVIRPEQSKSFNRKLEDICRHTTIYVLHDVNSHSLSLAEKEVEKEEYGGVSLDSLTRRRRNIRQCKTSCCYVVCCCDVKHFVFQTDQEFSCIHVCNGCTAKYRQKIEKIC